MERQRRERGAQELVERTRLKRAAAKHTMALWNAALAAGWRTIFYPSVGTALTTGCHWLHVVCPACQQIGETDLRKIDIHPHASLALWCTRCPANAARHIHRLLDRSVRRGGRWRGRSGGSSAIGRCSGSRSSTEAGHRTRSQRARSSRELESLPKSILPLTILALWAGELDQ
jgi:hypothetical protein